MYQPAEQDLLDPVSQTVLPSTKPLLQLQHRSEVGGVYCFSQLPVDIWCEGGNTFRFGFIEIVGVVCGIYKSIFGLNNSSGKCIVNCQVIQ